MDTITQLVTIAAVVFGGLTTWATNQLMERSRRKDQRRVRWDEKKLDAYVEYVGSVRACIYAAVLAYEVTHDLRSMPRTEHELLMDLTEAEGRRALAFERLMMLAEDRVIDAAHEVNATALAIDWRARRLVVGTLEEWRALHAGIFRAINAFHELARADLGVSGGFVGDSHTSRGLILPESRTPAVEE
ncbi:hypothetical protein GCM10010495_15110 [Kitasatospora herbaricolor]|uniref:hypothetical protein n=1 Tax=Kitasatospora herbaricolor TaxID=68217 RepID=UPI00174D9EF7|nr:hypothetical protein [Kitasatospora herbaricolor]MDQ0309314.1 hypothetical protein [Kitasatospora herbaricolor]GGV04357.1 hypothetical protein GCM10010495_15110 [Kitasatospora herbaricolor]